MNGKRAFLRQVYGSPAIWQVVWAETIPESENIEIHQQLGADSRYIPKQYIITLFENLELATQQINETVSNLLLIGFKEVSVKNIETSFDNGLIVPVRLSGRIFQPLDRQGGISPMKRRITI